MRSLKKMISEFRLRKVKDNLKRNAEEIYKLYRDGSNYMRNYNEQLRLMSCKSYLENKLSRIH